ncbi:hypothetical protein JW933_11160, partial [candidate division FCPU426 bacterium]|nr:hypothetical protein [candidate division FCPU426 bacterium]
LILTVPADMRLWSGRDLRLGHKTRYTVEALTARVRASGLEVLKASYANAFYYWPYRVVLWWRRRGRQNAVPPIKTNTYDVHPLVNYLFALFLKIEAWIILKGKLPWGVSAVCVARKPLGRSRW